jgi:Helix-turn-helix
VLVLVLKVHFGVVLAFPIDTNPLICEYVFMDREQLIAKLKQLVEKAGSQAALAKELGVSPSYLSDVLNGLRQPGISLLAPLGLESITEYRKVAP